MASKPKSTAPRSRKQADPITDLGSALIASARRNRASLEAKRKFNTKLTTKQRATLDRELKKAKTRELQVELVQLRSLGIYSPILEGDQFTKSQRYSIRKKFRLAQDMQRHGVFAEFPKNITKSQRLQIIKMSKARGGKATKRGIYIPRNEKELKGGKGRIIREADTGLFKVSVTKTFKTREGRTIQRKEDRYLDGEIALLAVEKKLKRRVDRIVKELEPKERMIFAIGGPDGNRSHRSFRSFNEMKSYLEGYKSADTTHGLTTLMASLSILRILDTGWKRRDTWHRSDQLKKPARKRSTSKRNKARGRA